MAGKRIGRCMLLDMLICISQGHQVSMNLLSKMSGLSGLSTKLLLILSMNVDTFFCS